MSNVIRHHKFVLDQDDKTIAGLDAAIEACESTISFLLRSEHNFSPSNYTEIFAICAGTVAEIKKMKLERSFTQERLLNLSFRLEDFLNGLEQQRVALDQLAT